MNNIKLITDSTSDLSEEIIKKYDIAVVPLYVVFGEESYRDGVDITTAELYEKVDAVKMLPKTSAPTPVDFWTIFRGYIDAGKDIVYIGLSSQMSSTIQNARLAAAEFPEGRIEVIDSANLSTGIGLLVLKAADLAGQGAGVREIAEKVKEYVPRVKTRFIINTLDYLYKGGRCTALESFVGGLFKIKPVVTVKEGKMTLEEKIRGKREKALANMLENALLDNERMDEDRIFITHSQSTEDAEYLRKELQSRLKVKEVLVTDAGCVISSHCGPNTVGILYISKNIG